MIRGFVIGVFVVLVGGGMGLVIASTVMNVSQPSKARAHQRALPSYGPGKADPTLEAQREVLRDEEYLGVLLAGRTLEVTPPFDGRIESIDVRLGDTVREDDVLFRMEADSLVRQLAGRRAALRARHAEVAAASARVQTTRDAVERVTKMQDAVSPRELAEVQFGRDEAEAQLAAAHAQVTELAEDVQRLAVARREASVRAPFAGTIAARYVDPGAAVGPLRPALRVVDPSQPFVRFAVPESVAARLAIGAHVSVSFEEGRAPAQGEVSHIAPDIEIAARLVFVEARLFPPLPTNRATGAAARVVVQ